MIDIELKNILKEWYDTNQKSPEVAKKLSQYLDLGDNFGEYNPYNNIHNTFQIAEYFSDRSTLKDMIWLICRVCGGYDGETDKDLLDILKTQKETGWYERTAEKLDLDPKYVVTMIYILCSGDLLDYGTSPRGAFTTSLGNWIIKEDG